MGVNKEVVRRFRPTFHQPALSGKTDCRDAGVRTRIDKTSVPGVKQGMRILGMTLWPEKISDEQYIEQIRKRVKQGRRWRYFVAVMGLAFIGLMVCMILISISLLADYGFIARKVGHSLPPPTQEQIYGTFCLAILMGGYCGVMIGQMLLHLVTLFIGYREDKLLVECWDALSEAEKARLRQRSS